MTVSFPVPGFLLAWFVTIRVAWTVTCSVPPDRAAAIFRESMTGAGMGTAQRVSGKLGSRGQVWTVSEGESGLLAVCVGGWPARIFTRNKTIRLQPDGQVIGFDHIDGEGPTYSYDLIPDTLHTFWGLLSFTGETRHFYRRTIKRLRKEGGEVSVRYPLSVSKIALWVGLVVILIAANT